MTHISDVSYVRRNWRLGAAIAAMALVTGCGSGSDEITAKPATIAQLASKINGCAPKAAPGRLKGYQQASCQAPSGLYVLNTFTTDRGQAAWLDHAKIYGGTYLVGPKWIVVGKRQPLEQLRAKIGGDIHTRNTKTNPQKPYSEPTG
jgi:hypothetical protein